MSIIVMHPNLKKLKSILDVYAKFKDNDELRGTEREVAEHLIFRFFDDVLGWNTKDPYEFRRELSQNGKRMDGITFVNGLSQFIIECKSLTKNINDNTLFYEQAIHYANSKEKSFAILTNFETFIILRCDIQVDNPLKAQIANISLAQIEKGELDLLANFQKQYWVEKGKDNELYSRLDLKRKDPISKQLLNDLIDWRNIIRNNLKKHAAKNGISFEKEIYSIEEEIQRFLDRLIFVCYCEDKELEESQLKALISDKSERGHDKQGFLLNKIVELFEYYRKRYDSDLFQVGLCDRFFVEDHVIAAVLNGLRQPHNKLPYDFSIIPIDILGKVYENFLGHIIQKKSEKEDIGKRKHEGIYYTHEYIVNYIVDNTVRAYVKGKSFNEILKVSVLDPACGSGSFLIRVFDVLVEESEIMLKRELTYEEKEKLVLNCIYGVDKDERACDIAKLNLSLKIAARGKKIPELHNNVRNGNSLVDDDEIDKIHFFKWEDKFPKIIGNGGFDVVIGNPPYGSKKMLSDEEKKFIKTKHKYTDSGDTAEMFIEKAFDLLKKDGYFGFIVPKPLTYITSWHEIRKFLMEKNIHSIIDVSKAFEDVLLEQVIICAKNQPCKGSNIIIGNESNDQINVLDAISPNCLTERIYQICLYGKNKQIYKTMTSGTDNLIEHFGIWAGVGGITPKLSRSKVGPLILKGKSIDRYALTDELWYVPKSILTERDIEEHKPKRIVCQDIVAHIMNPEPHIKITATIADAGVLTNETIINFSPKDDKLNLETLLCMLNSKLISWFVYKFIFNNAIRTMHYRPGYADYTPIKMPRNQEIFVKLCNKMLALNKQLNETNETNKYKRAELTEEINRTQEEIDEAVYKLYGITTEERKIVEARLDDSRQS